MPKPMRDDELRRILTQGVRNGRNEAGMLDGDEPADHRARLITFLNATYTRLPRLSQRASMSTVTGTDETAYAAFEAAKQALLSSLRDSPPETWAELDCEVRGAYGLFYERFEEELAGSPHEHLGVYDKNARRAAVAFCEACWMPVTGGDLLQEPQLVGDVVEAIIAAFDPPAE